MVSAALAFANNVVAGLVTDALVKLGYNPFFRTAPPASDTEPRFLQDERPDDKHNPKQQDATEAQPVTL